MRYQTWFLGNKVSAFCTRAQRYTRWMKHEPFYAASSPEPTGEICADICDQIKCLQCRDFKCQNLPKYLSNRASIFLSYTEEFYRITIAIVVTQNVFLSCSKIDLRGGQAPS